MLRSVIRRTVIGTVTLGLMVALARAAQDPPAEFIHISARPETLGSPYPVQTTDQRVGGWLYPGEVVTVEVTVGNQTRQALRLEGSWHNNLRIVVRPVPEGSRGGPNTESPLAWTWEFVGRLRGAQQPQGDEITLLPRRNDTVRFVLASPVPPPAGTYELRLEWLVPLLSEEQTSRTRLESGPSLLGVRGVDTRLDQLNQAAHIATWARLRKDYPSAREWLQTMLRLNPSSGAAFSQLGSIAEETGDCGEAIARWTKAIELMSTDGDPEARPLSGSAKDDVLGGLARQIEKCRK